MKNDPSYYNAKTENIMYTLITTWECTIIDCAVRLTGEFSAMDIQAELNKIRAHKLGEKGILIVLNRLTTKKLLKKRYVRQKFLKFRPLYQLNLENQVYCGNPDTSDLCARLHENIWEQAEEQLIRQETDWLYRLLYFPFPSHSQKKPEYLSEEERQELQKIIDEQ